MIILDKRQQIRARVVQLDSQINYLELQCRKAYRTYRRKCDYGSWSFNLHAADVLLEKYELYRDAADSLREYKNELTNQL